MELICPKCNNIIPSTTINVTTDLAKCENCGSLHKASELSESKTKALKLTPPLGSSIEMKKGLGGGVTVFLPKTGFKKSNIALLFFSIFWLLFITVWTWGAFQSSILFALFSIPFWLIGFAMFISSINSAHQSQTIKVTNDTLILTKKQPIKGETHTLKLKNIDTVKMSHKVNSSFNSLKDTTKLSKMQIGNSLMTPTIIIGVKQITFFESAEQVEQEWITNLISAIVEKERSSF